MNYKETIEIKWEGQYFFNGVTSEQESYEVDIYENDAGDTFIKSDDGYEPFEYE